MADTLPFREVWFADFEYHQPAGECPSPVCLVAHELFTGKRIRLFGEELTNLKEAPFPTGPDVLFVSYYAAAEMSCFLALGWKLPERILDLFAEFRCTTNGLPVPSGSVLLGAMAYFGLPTMDAIEKSGMRNLAQRGGPYTDEEREALLAYCESDVVALGRLLPVMLPHIDLPRALLRGRYMCAVSRMERNGVPIDVSNFCALSQQWEPLKRSLLSRADVHGLWEQGSFRAKNFKKFLQHHDITWPTEGNRLKLDDDTFRQMAKMYPIIAPIRELRHTLSQLRLNELAVGSDGRNRCMLSPLRSKTGRNQPSNSKFIFGPSVWLRGLIQASPGRAIAYVDWSQQEFGIAAALSGDAAMMEAYASGDPYLAFAKQAGAVPDDATKVSHPVERSRFKVCALAVQYGMREASLAFKLGEPQAAARELLRLHRQTYRRYWEWNDGLVDAALLGSPLRTVFGWTLHPHATRLNARSLSNFPMQANGAEMLRLACCMATERGIQVCAPVHDAVLIEADTESIDDTVAEMQAVMAEASRIVLDGFELLSDAKVFRHPERYEDERGTEMWGVVMAILDELGHPADEGCIAPAQVPVSP